MIIKIVTLSLMAVFYICYFAKLISQKKQGINTDQLGKGKEGFVKFIEVTLKIITYLHTCSPILLHLCNRNNKSKYTEHCYYNSCKLQHNMCCSRTKHNTDNLYYRKQICD